MKKLLILSLFVIPLFFIFSCSVSQKTINNAEKRIETLKSKGVPDSSLSRALVFLFQAKDSKKRGNRGLARMSGDSMLIIIAKAEDDYKRNMDRLKPWSRNQRQTLVNGASGLTGLHKQCADSIVAIIDSFININWLYQAESQINYFKKYLSHLILEEETAKELRPKVFGRWICTNIIKHSEDKTVHAVEKKTFSFNRDGKVKLIEEKKGKSTPFFKEDWQFLSWGEFKLKGDSIYLLIDRFKAVKQNFWDLKQDEKGKKEWIKNEAETYDSTITDGSQDRYIIYNDLIKDFKKG